jgi:hypothetical protein
MRLLAGLLFTACLLAATPAYASDRVVVRFSNAADASDRAAARDAADASRPQSIPGLSGVQVVTVPEGDASAAARTLNRADGVVWAQPEHVMHVAAAMPSGPGNDSINQWGLLNTGQTTYDSVLEAMVPGTPDVDGNFMPAWDTTMGGGQTIAVVDTGVDFGIRDLGVNAAANGHDFVDGDSDPAPVASSSIYTNHGTHVAGIAAASLGVNQTHDIVGGAPDARIMALRALDGNGSGTDAAVAAAFAWAADHGARIVNASLGGAGQSEVLHQAIASHPNTLFVVAAGNDGADEDALSADDRDYPCADPSPNVVCVAAVNSVGNLASFSNYGAGTVDLGAPGEGIVSYKIGGSLLTWDGTSQATPFVSAAAALALAAQPCATPEQLRDELIASARPLAALDGKTVSGGMLDAAQLIAENGQPSAAPRTCAVATLPATTPTVGRTLTATGSFDRGTVTWQWDRCATSCTPIPGATGAAYAPQAADVGKRLRATATATDGDQATSSTSAQTASAVVAPAPAPRPATPAPAPAPVSTPKPAPVVTPAPLRSPKLSVHKPRRRHGKIAVSGSVTRSFSGTVTIKVCLRRHCRTVHARVRHARFAASIRPPRHGKLTVTVSVRSGRGFKAAHARRTIRA